MEGRAQLTTQTQNYVVARFRDGKMIKGVTYDFGPQKKSFHVTSTGEDGKRVFKIPLSELKAVFFVKSLEGRKDPLSLEGLRREDPEATGPIKVKITFYDGETLVGTTQGYTPEREGFFIVPSERDSNNLRIFVISNAVKQIKTWK